MVFKTATAGFLALKASLFQNLIFFPVGITTVDVKLVWAPKILVEPLTPYKPFKLLYKYCRRCFTCTWRFLLDNQHGSGIDLCLRSNDSLSHKSQFYRIGRISKLNVCSILRYSSASRAYVTGTMLCTNLCIYSTLILSSILILY